MSNQKSIFSAPAGVCLALALLLILTNILCSNSAPTTQSNSSDNMSALDCIPGAAAREQAQVTYVVDGDTIHVAMNGQEYKVRYIGMDTPEDTKVKEYFGAEATQRNRQLVDGKTVTLVKDVSETDKYGRLLRYVIVDGVFVNDALVAEGYANSASFPPDVACQKILRQSEHVARQSNFGLWAK